MSAVLFLVTIPTEEEEERLKNDYITRKIESKSLKSETNTIKANNNDTKSDAVSVQIEPSAPIVKSVHYSDTFPRRKSEADSLLAFDGSANCNGGGDGGDGDGDADNVTTKAASKGQESNGSVKSDNTEQQINCAELRRKSIEGFRDMITSAKRKTSIKPINTDLDLPYDACMEKVLKEILTKLEVMNVIWTKDLDGKTFQVTFSIEVNKVYEDILKKLNEWGIGDREGSSVTVLNCIASKKFAGNFDSEEDLFANGGDKFQEESAWDRFMDTVRSRLNVVQVVNNVRQDASITFDFCVMVVCAAILAAFGLVDDSTIFLAASMLISPLMGPIIASIFGTVIKDVSLRMLGIKNELFGLSLALSVGFIFGLILCGIDDRYSRGEGLSVEMLSRCELRSLLVGVFTAIPSGAAVAVAILGGNIGSLVGVAISASLLPPAVNTGILWSIACVYKFYEYDDSRYSSVIKEPKYSQNQAAELAILGSISMCLTIVNIICIYVMGILMLKMKEIAPISTKQTTTSFWKHDVKIARNLQKTGYNTDQCLIDEFTNLPQSDQKALGINADILRSLQVDDAQYQNTWSPIARHTLMDSYHDNQATVNGLERLYATIHHQKPYRPYVRQFSYGRPLDRVSEIVRPYNRLSDHFPRRATMPTKAMQEATIPENVTTSTSTLKSNMTTPTGTGDLSKRRKFIVTPAQVDPFSKDAEK